MLIVDAEKGTNGYGVFVVIMSGPGKPTMDVTFFRNRPIKVESYTFGDPFGDSTARITFPQITPYDDLESKALWFCNEWNNVDIYWVPCIDTKMSVNDYAVINPLAPNKLLYTNFSEKQKVWEGYTVSIKPTDEGMTLDCQGALFELDRYLAQPTYPDRPWAHEACMATYFSKATWDKGVKYTKRTKPLRIEWPSGWSKRFTTTTPTLYTPRGIRVGSNWTGYSTRSTGSWSRVLTGFTQDLLAVMYTDEDCGVTAGNQWTIRKYENRIPVLKVRDRYKEPDFELYYGTPGVVANLSRDGMSIANVVYGTGSGFDGGKWTNANPSNDGTITTYLPIAYDSQKYPKTKSAYPMIAETLINFGAGVDLVDGIKAAQKMLQRDSEPGWTGDITVQVDPSDSMSRWTIAAGMTVMLKGFAGKREGVRLHIAEVTCNPEAGTVAMKVDSQYRDLLTLEEVTARVRDPLTPVKMLQVNRRAQIIEDVNAPWDYSAGSGYIPRSSVNLFRHKPEELVYPWDSWLQAHPPSVSGGFYVRIPANAASTKGKWVMSVPVLMGAAGTIRRSVFTVVDREGVRLEIPFHVSFYYNQVPSIPFTGTNYSPFYPDHFESVGADGVPFPPLNFNQPDDSFIVGWGNANQKGGYSPGRSSEGGTPTGMLIDESAWSWDMNGKNENYDPYHVPKQGQQPLTARQIYMCAYAEYSTEVYLVGRLWRMEPGTG